MKSKDINQLHVEHYHHPFGMGNGHVQSIYPTILRSPPLPDWKRFTVPTPDGDEIHVDFWQGSSPGHCAVLSHGLGGHSHRAYITGMAHALHRKGWSIAAWNFRGTLGSPMKRPVFTHNGATHDLQAVIDALPTLMASELSRLALVGFSMGGNLTLVYLGRHAGRLPSALCGAVVFSVPSDLNATSWKLAKWSNRIYMNRFLRDLREMLEPAARLFPEVISLENYSDIRNFADFDNRYTAPLHGFRDALDYWTQCSSLPLLGRIQTPTLIVNARNDPFLTPSCFPEETCAANPFLRLIAPETGGHCGFVQFNARHTYWSEQIAADFLGYCTR
jgi:predicted alpha/beta-fold hydrolase